MGERSRRVRAVTLIVIALLLIGSPALSELGQHAGAPGLAHVLPYAAATQSSLEYGMIELGYNTATLIPANTSVPTFSLGDQMWMLSEFNTSVNVRLSTPAGAVVVNTVVSPNAATLIFSFNASYIYDGTWTLNVFYFGSFNVPISFVDPSANGMQATMVSYGFQGNQLAVGFSLSSPGSYGVSGCLLPKSSLGAIVLTTPYAVGSDIAIQNTGNGSVSISTGGQPVLYAPNSSVSISFPSQNASAPHQPFEFWLELYYSYSYQSAGQQSNFVSTYLEAARTSAVFLSASNENAHPQLDELAGMRSGAYELRGFFEVGGNLSVEQTNILIQGSTQLWVPLSGCAITTQSTPTFVATSTLSSSSSEWPSTLFLSYYVAGVNLYLLQPLAIQLSGFTLFVSSLQEVPTNIGIEVNASSEAYSIVGESVFIASVGPPPQVNYSLNFGGKVFQSSPPTYYSGFGTQETNLGRMNVMVTFNGNGYRNATVTLLNNALDGAVVLRSDSQGNATFFGPAGNYTLTVSVNGSTLTRTVSLAAGQSSLEQVSLNQVSQPLLSPGELEVVVLASAAVVAGIAANLWVWVFRSRRVMRK